MKRTEVKEILNGRGLLHLADQYAEVEYVIRVFQDFDDDVPTVKSARGGLKLPNADGTLGNVAAQLITGLPLNLELQDGRTAQVLFTQLDGEFLVTGPIC